MVAEDSTTSSTSRAARELGDLLASIEVRADWTVVEATAQSLADELRNRDSPVDKHTALGKTLLPQTINSLLKTALEGSRIPDDSRAPSVLQLLRIGANLCMDHNENRGYLLDAGFPETSVSLLEGYAELLPEIPSYDPLPLSEIHLKIIRTAIGALLNLSLGYEPVQKLLIALEVPVTLLRLAVSIYPTGSWLSAKGKNATPINEENWLIRKGIINWSSRTVSNLKDKLTETQQSAYGPEVLPYLAIPLGAFLPPFPSPDNLTYLDTDTRDVLFATDVDMLQEACEILEALTMDVEDVRVALARGMASNEQTPCLALMLDFIELAEYPPVWQAPDAPREEITRWKSVVDLCKTAIIRSVVEIAGEDANMDVLWDDAIPDNGFVSRLIKWLQAEHTHNDLVVCATLGLGNLVRRENRSIALLRPPASIAPYLVKHLKPTTDIKVKHGVIGLLKHLAQSPSNRDVLGEARVLEALCTCGILRERSIIAEVVQLPAINLAKHLCTNNVANSIVCVLDADDEQLSSSCLKQILVLSRRSDSVPVKSEGARVLVNVIKSLCSSSGNVHDPRRQSAIKALISPECAAALARLLGRSTKHVILLNESIIGMVLLALKPEGALFVLDAVVAELPKEISPSSRQNSLDPNAASSAEGAPSSPIPGAKTALDVLVQILENAEGRFPVELRANLCQLLAEIGRESLKAESGGREAEVEQVRAATRQTLEALQSTPDSLSLSAAARKALQAW